MKINNIVFILLAIFMFLFKGCDRPEIINLIPQNKSEIIQKQTIPQSSYHVPYNRTDYPYIENECLYTKLRTIEIKFIKRIELEESPIRYFIITWQKDAYTMGMFTMSYEDFSKIEITLLGDTYAKKFKEQEKK
jgi:hypothetical protein